MSALASRARSRGRLLIEARITKQTASVKAEWTRHLGRTSASQLRRALTRLREITDPYQ